MQFKSKNNNNCQQLQIKQQIRMFGNKMLQVKIHNAEEMLDNISKVLQNPEISNQNQNFSKQMQKYVQTYNKISNLIKDKVRSAKFKIKFQAILSQLCNKDKEQLSKEIKILQVSQKCQKNLILIREYVYLWKKCFQIFKIAKIQELLEHIKRLKQSEFFINKLAYMVVEIKEALLMKQMYNKQEIPKIVRQQFNSIKDDILAQIVALKQIEKEKIVVYDNNSLNSNFANAKYNKQQIQKQQKGQNQPTQYFQEIATLKGQIQKLKLQKTELQDQYKNEKKLRKNFENYHLKMRQQIQTIFKQFKGRIKQEGIYFTEVQMFTLIKSEYNQKISLINTHQSLIEERELQLKRLNQKTTNQKIQLIKENEKKILDLSENKRRQIEKLQQQQRNNLLRQKQIQQSVLNQVEGLKKILNIHEDTIKTLNNNISDHQIEYTVLNEQLKKYKQKSLSLQQNLMNQINAKQIQIKAKHIQIQQLQAMYKELEDQVDRTKYILQKVKQSQSTIEKLKQDVCKLQEQKYILTQSSQRKTQLENNEIQQNNSKDQLISQICRKCLQGQEQIRRLKNHIQTLKLQKDNQSNKLRQNNLSISNLEKETLRLKQQNIKNEQKLKKQLSDQRIKMESQIRELNIIKQKLRKLEKELKDQKNNHQCLKYQYDSLSPQIERLSLELDMCREQNNTNVKTFQQKQTSLTIKLREREEQSEKLKLQLQKYVAQLNHLNRQLQQKSLQIFKLHKNLEQGSNRNKISSLSKVPLEITEQIRKQIQMKYQKQLLEIKSQFIHFYCQRYNKIIEALTLEGSPADCLYIDSFFQGEILEGRMEEKIRILTHLYRLNKQVALKTRLLTKLDLRNPTNFHSYIDNTPNILCITKTLTGACLAGYYSGRYAEATMTEPGLLISVTNNDSYYLNVGDSNCKTIFRAMIYDPYYLIFGNAEFRIRSGEKSVFCNFGINNSYFNHRGRKINDFLCAGGEREVEIASYEIYEVVFQQGRRE